jgi:energy-coupling factor transporter ATP-binding protein EcfA2
VSKRPLIAIYGKAGSGKSTLASALSRRYHNIPIRSFAGPLKLGCRAMGAVVEGPNKDREILQIIGTDVFRRIKGPDHWVNLMDTLTPSRNDTGLIIDDVRFRNEYDWAGQNGFCVIKLEGSFNPAVGLWSQHDSETDMDALTDEDFDLVFTLDQPVSERVDITTSYLMHEFGIYEPWQAELRGMEGLV